MVCVYDDDDDDVCVDMCVLILRGYLRNEAGNDRGALPGAASRARNGAAGRFPPGVALGWGCG